VREALAKLAARLQNALAEAQRARRLFTVTSNRKHHGPPHGAGRWKGARFWPGKIASRNPGILLGIRRETGSMLSIPRMFWMHGTHMSTPEQARRKSWIGLSEHFQASDRVGLLNCPSDGGFRGKEHRRGYLRPILTREPFFRSPA